MIRLLLMGCSARKRPDPGRLPAAERYDGPAFRTLRAYRHEHPEHAASLDVLILSAEFGLIAAATPIPDYDRPMTTGRALWLRSQVGAALARQLALRAYSSTLISLGADYLPALPLDPTITAGLGRLSWTEGGIGTRLGQLKRWLHPS